jgi:hypothetical protein
LELITPVLAMAIRRPRGAWGLRCVCVGSIQGKGRRVLRQPGCGKSLDLQCFEGDRAQHLVEIGRKQRGEEVAQAVILERGTRESRLQQRHHPPLFQPLPHLVEGLMPIPNREDQSFDPATTREPVCRVGQEEAVDHGGACQTP